MTSGISIDGYMKVKDRDIKLVYPSSALLCWSCSLPHLADYQPLTVSQSTTSPTPVERASFSILTDKALRLLLNVLLATLARHSVSHGGMETRLWLIWPVMHLSRWAMGKQLKPGLAYTVVSLRNCKMLITKWVWVLRPTIAVESII